MVVTGVTKLEKGIKPYGEVGLGSSRAFFISAKSHGLSALWLYGC